MPEPTTRESTELLGEAVSTGAPPQRLMGPPFPVRFEVVHTNAWPACMLLVKLGEQTVLAIKTQEPRLKALATWLLDESS